MGKLHSKALKAAVLQVGLEAVHVGLHSGYSAGKTRGREWEASREEEPSMQATSQGPAGCKAVQQCSVAAMQRPQPAYPPSSAAAGHMQGGAPTESSRSQSQSPCTLPSGHSRGRSASALWLPGNALSQAGQQAPSLLLLVLLLLLILLALNCLSPRGEANVVSLVVHVCM